ncbi:bacillithiol system redox-active protein YtxJ [Halobacillus campisalis]|uniref:Bacillithiol system redox-active protein YtxJ n=1 Tax=Halobacillus campisalis TaxID=435909 RepID=A0ABW2K0N1_9BACI|nr:bacillithiol system redox-active protein YtxJ [Halobacillus campisalis]
MSILLNSKEEFNKVNQSEDKFFLMKHSLTCPISAMAKKEFDQFSEQTSAVCYVLHVQESRELSHFIAEEFNVRHESPQALYFEDKEVKWHDSHNQIKTDVLKAVSS